MSELTPMIKQYLGIKEKNKDAILLFRLGDFYEMFFDDAKVASKILQITLTSRGVGRGKKVPMCGVPHHAVDGYIARLVKAGYRVAICDQVEDAALAKGIVKREIVRFITPGTVLSQGMLEDKENNFLVALNKDGDGVGLALVDLSTGEFKVTQLKDGDELVNELTRLSSRECLLPESCADEIFLKRVKREDEVLITRRDDFSFIKDNAQRLLTAHFRTHSLEGFGCEDLPLAVGAAGALLEYLQETQKTALSHIVKLTVYSTSEFMVLDRATQRNLELTQTLMGSKNGSLLSVLDDTVSVMGGRKLRGWMQQPLVNTDKVRERQTAVGEFYDGFSLRDGLRQLVKNLPDLERLSSRACCGLAHGQDLVSLSKALKVIPEVKKCLGSCRSGLINKLNGNLEMLEDVAEYIDKALVEEPPLSLRDGGLIRVGYAEELDKLRRVSGEGKGWIARLQKREIERTKISSLKVRFNKVFGYYIEVTKANLASVPEDYIRKQTMVNAERFITPELKEYESQVLGAEERIKELEYNLFLEIRSKVAEEAGRILKSADILASLDVLAALAEVAVKNSYVKPEVNDGKVVSVKDGRHPVLEKVLEEPFVPNDTALDDEENQLIIITGPNMAGKSTYIRQIALTVLMAQMGSFVPAKEAVLGTVDRIFTRIGAGDELTRGMSTFMMEMNETANILNNATSRSLIILDEIGRGTSTFDGISIAWAVAEYICKSPALGTKTLFATHYHELTELALTLKGVKNYNVAVREWNDEVVFLRKVVEGCGDKSYGIHVARLAGLPREVIERAKDILVNLEKGAFTKEGKPVIAGLPDDEDKADETQLSLFEVPVHPLVDEIKNIKVDELTPRQALDKLYKLKDIAED